MTNTLFSSKWPCWMVLIAMICSTEVSKGAKPSEKFLWLSNPYWRVGAINEPGLDAAGFSDKFYWGASPPSLRHAAAYEHEMLSGEWAAAIYYDGIATGAEAMWLTDKFFLPDWTTNSQFIIDSDPVSSDNVNNLVVGLDTGYSRIKNAQVRITIDYEMVDLGQQGENGEGGSPLSFGSLVGADAFVYSERYILLQTYTIKNITASPIVNLKFYQMLHGHPGNEYNGVVYSVYDSTYHEDPLESYTPWNAVHTVGNFRYDITQWNNFDDPEKGVYVDHRDWIGFSSTVPPDFFENGYYEGHAAGKPPRDPDPDLTGTHWNIEDRNLNGKTYSFGQVAGAMGWSLGTLAPHEQEGDSVKLTLAIMFGAGPIQKTCQPFELVANWGFDEGSGTIAYDSIGDNDGALVGNPQWVEGFLDGALEFDGDGDYVELSHPVGALTGDSVTISAWVKPGQGMVSSKIYDIFSQTKGSASDLYGYDLYLAVDSEGMCRAAFSLRYWDTVSPGGCYVWYEIPLVREEWVWLVGTNDGTTLKVYVNGELDDLYGTDDSTGRMGVYSAGYIGYLPADPPFIGVIDCVRVLACAWDGEEGCLPYCHKDYFDWVLLDRPDCWCSSAVLGEDISDTGPPDYTAGDYQCEGDANTDRENPLAKWRVSASDLSLVIANWQKTADDETLNPCADIDHAEENPLAHWRVSASDLSIVITNWKKKAGTPPTGLAGDCAERGCQGEALGRGSPGTQLTGKELLNRLAEIWLDPDVQKSIDEEKFLKVYESLKELSNQ